MTLELAGRMVLATALGLLVGLERLRAGKEAGIRTFALVALTGSLSQLAGSALYGVLALILTGVVMVIASSHALLRRERPEVTTAAALVATSFIGVLAGQGQDLMAISGTIIVLLLLAWKEEMVEFSRHLTSQEVHAAITLLLVGGVILPLLPDHPVDPWGLVSPRHIWIIVVLISGLGFGTYVLLRLYGTRGLAYSGFLGGLVNSTATVAQMAAFASGPDALPPDDVIPAIMLAKCAMYLRNLVIVALLAPAALVVGALPLGLMAAVSLVFALRHRMRSGPQARAVRLSSPFSLRAALGLGLYVLTLTVIGGTAHRLLGTGAFYAVSMIGGLVSSSSVAVSTAVLVRQGTLPTAVAAVGVVLASIASGVALLPLVPRTNGGTMLRQVALAVVIAAVAAIGGLMIGAWSAGALRG